MASSVSSFPLPFRASKLFITFSFWRRGRRRREREGNRGKKIGGSAKKILSLPYFYSLPPFSNKRHRNSLPVFIAGKKTKKTFFSRNLPAKRQSLDISPPPPLFLPSSSFAAGARKESITLELEAIFGPPAFRRQMWKNKVVGGKGEGEK